MESPRLREENKSYSRSYSSFFHWQGLDRNQARWNVKANPQTLISTLLLGLSPHPFLPPHYLFNFTPCDCTSETLVARDGDRAHTAGGSRGTEGEKGCREGGDGEGMGFPTQYRASVIL